MTQSIWKNDVRAHELDVQGIVNNAHYFCYFDHARTLHLKEMNIDWERLSQKGLNLVLTHADIRFSHSLRAFESFEVITTLEKEGRLKLIFKQQIYNKAGTLICTGTNIVVCVDSKRNKPVAIDSFMESAQAT